MGTNPFQRLMAQRSSNGFDSVSVSFDAWVAVVVGHVAAFNVLVLAGELR
jgi:hypothetical protein